MSKLSVKVYKNIMSANEEWVEKIRALCARSGIVLWNIIGSPGCGKTALLEKLCPLLSFKHAPAVLEGDVETANDAERLARLGIFAHQIVTHGACHLGAEVIYKALSDLPEGKFDTVFVENVGNLVCPAEFDIGEKGKIAVLSVTEGEDKPLKYPLLFREARAVVITKIDLLPHLQVERERYLQNIRDINNSIPIFEISSFDDSGMAALADWFAQTSIPPS